MFRHTLRRCAGRVAASSYVVAPRVSPIAVRSTAVSHIRPVVPTRIAGLVSRSYSSEAEAAAPQAHEQEATGKFASLAELGVHPSLLKAITVDMGYEDMTPVQDKTIKPAMNGTDIVAQAKTGTGKTLAFLLPLLQRMIQEDPSLADRSAARRAHSTDIRGIVISPTRELAEQIALEARRLTAKTGLVVQCAVGGTRKGDMLRQTQRQGCHLLVATPGRLNDLLEDPRSGIDAPNLAAMVLDEADRMLDVGFEKELSEIISRLPTPDEKVRQTILVSATIPDNVIRLARDMVRPDDFQFVQTIGANESLTHDRVKQSVVTTSNFNNVLPTLFELIDREIEAANESDGRPFKAIVYFNTTAMVQLTGALAQERRREGLLKIPTITINSKLTQGQREKAAKMFKVVRSGILFSSDVTARGMDFPNVTHVIQIDTPRDRESYIHRLGRTARQNKDGEGWLILPPQSVKVARNMLEGLPLQPDSSLESASVELSSGKLTRHHEEMQSMGKWMPKDLLVTAYSSIFGGFTGDKRSLVSDLNEWSVEGMGMDQPPEFSEKWVNMMGLKGTGIRVRASSRFDADGGGGRGFGGGDRRRGGGGFGGRESGDAFDEMRDQSRSDDYGSRGGRGQGRGGRGGWDGGRSSGGGYGRDRRYDF